jgi:hypothetical protein
VLPAVSCLLGALQIYFYFYSLLRAAVVTANRRRKGMPAVSAGSVAARTEDIGVPASLLVAAVAGAVNMVLTSPAQVGWGVHPGGGGGGGGFAFQNLQTCFCPSCSHSQQRQAAAHHSPCMCLFCCRLLVATQMQATATLNRARLPAEPLPIFGAMWMCRNLTVLWQHPCTWFLLAGRSHPDAGHSHPQAPAGLKGPTLSTYPQ